MNRKALTICTVYRTLEFDDWFNKLNTKTQITINARIQRILLDEHLGLTNYFDKITELKWKSGLRVYSYIDQDTMILLLGGNKNGQNKDIQKAKKILYTRLTKT
jgi:putative addiction module killer protein